jgi:hypothetical protein
MTKHSEMIPDFITAQSPRGLRLLMFKSNAKYGGQFQYFDISHHKDARGRDVWTAWYYRPIKNLEELNDDAR